MPKEEVDACEFYMAYNINLLFSSYVHSPYH